MSGGKLREALKHIEKHADESEFRRYWRNLGDGKIEEKYEFWVTLEGKEAENHR